MPAVAGHKSTKGLLKGDGLHGIHHAGNVVLHPKQVAAKLAAGKKAAKPAAPKEYSAQGFIGKGDFTEPIDLTVVSL